MSIKEKLEEFFAEEDLEWRLQSCGKKGDNFWAMALCYVQARAIQKRLDDVFGWNGWQDEYRVEGNDIICRLSVFDTENNRWIAKENGASQTDIEAFKGGISGAFKRVASSGYGIGRYLYELETNFVETSEVKDVKFTERGKTKENQSFYWAKPRMKSQFLPKPLKFNKKEVTTNNKTVDHTKTIATVNELIIKLKESKDELSCTDALKEVNKFTSTAEFINLCEAKTNIELIANFRKDYAETKKHLKSLEVKK